ncbi:cutinase-domain-containing protein, partial [Boeremia exigua]|uniref:cutinase-domain-containing protein n=1 Tax=Boeremia exigua TaxID=749465 RepID=UPI001E8D9BC7
QGFIVGPQTSEGLKDAFGASAVATEGLEYEASLLDNLEPGGTDAAAAALMRDTLTAMAHECPRAVIVAGGYSQGAAVNHRAIEALPPAVQDRIAGVVLYGDTQAREDGGRIPGFPPQKVMVICQRGDLVCRGVPLVLPFHLTYGTRVDEGVAFLVRKIKDAQAGDGTEEAVFVVEEEVDGLDDGVEKIAVALVA